jgi:hypothetical protein
MESVSLLSFLESRLTRSSGKNSFTYFPYIGSSLEVLEPNLMELNLSEFTLHSMQCNLKYVHVSSNR